MHVISSPPCIPTFYWSLELFTGPLSRILADIVSIRSLRKFRVVLRVSNYCRRVARNCTELLSAVHASGNIRLRREVISAEVPSSPPWNLIGSRVFGNCCPCSLSFFRSADLVGLYQPVTREENGPLTQRAGNNTRNIIKKLQRNIVLFRNREKHSLLRGNLARRAPSRCLSV